MPDTKKPKARTKRTGILLTEYLKLEQRHEDVMDELDKIWYRLSDADRAWLDNRGDLSLS